MDDLYQIVAKIDDFRISKAKEARIGDLHLALFSVEDKLYAVENNCPHQHFEVLHQGQIEGCTITCPMHGRTFDLNTGNCLNDGGKLKKLEIKIVGHDVFVKQPPATSFALFDK